VLVRPCITTNALRLAASVQPPLSRHCLLSTLQCSKWGAIGGALIGQWAGLIFWLTWTKVCCCAAAAHAAPPRYVSGCKPRSAVPAVANFSCICLHTITHLLVTSYQVGYGDINLDTTGKDYPMLAGNLAAILISAFVCIVVSLIKPDNCNWDATRNLQMVEEEWTGAQCVHCVVSGSAGKRSGK
jgi:hypothetical protein